MRTTVALPDFTMYVQLSQSVLSGDERIQRYARTVTQRSRGITFLLLGQSFLDSVILFFSPLRNMMSAKLATCSWPRIKDLSVLVRASQLSTDIFDQGFHPPPSLDHARREKELGEVRSTT